MKVKISSLMKIMLLIILIGCERCFYLVNAEAINVAGVFNYKDIFIVFALIFSCVVFYVYRKYPTCRYRFKWLIIGVVVLSIISSIQSEILYGQEFIVGLRPQRFWIVWGILYFPLRRLLYLKKITIDDIIKMIFFIGTCEILLFSLQYVLGNNFQFLYVMTGSRYESDRYYFYNILLRLLLFINLDRIFQKKKVFISILYVISILFVLLVVGKMRMTSLSTLAAIATGIFLWRKGGVVKLGVGVVAGIVSLFLLSTPIVQDTVDTILDLQDGVVSSASTLSIRQYGRKLYMDSLQEHPLLGCGYINALHEEATAAAGFDKNVYLADNGLLAIAYMYGLLGVLWLLVFFSIFLKNGWKIYKQHGIQFIMLAPLGWLIAGMTEAHWYWDNGFICVTIILVMMEQYMNSRDEIVSKIIEKE